MKRTLIFIILFLVFASAQAQDAKLEEILQKYYQASAMEKLLKVNTVVSTGTLVQQDIMPYKVSRMRPDRYLLEFDVADMSAFQGYDGVTAWMTAPWTGNAKAQALPEDRAREMKVRADFEGVLWHWKEKGYGLETAGSDTVDGEYAWKLKLTRPEGGVEFYSIGKTSNLLLKRQYSRMVRGAETIMESVFKDYKTLDGIPFAYTIQNKMAKQLLNTVQYETIELNPKIDEKIFKMP